MKGSDIKGRLKTDPTGNVGSTDHQSQAASFGF